MKYSTIILAAGKSSRFGEDKITYFLKNKTIIEWSSQLFINDDNCQEIIIVAKSKHILQIEKIFQNISKIKIIIGGNTRFESVQKGLKLVSEEKVLIHDGARPFLDQHTLNQVLLYLVNNQAVIPVVNLVDSLKEIDNNEVKASLDRNNYGLAQTPQGFDTALIRYAYQKNNKNLSDDASYISAINKPIKIILGNIKNKKITTQNDL